MRVWKWLRKTMYSYYSENSFNFADLLQRNWGLLGPLDNSLRIAAVCTNAHMCVQTPFKKITLFSFFFPPGFPFQFLSVLFWSFYLMLRAFFKHLRRVDWQFTCKNKILKSWLDSVFGERILNLWVYPRALALNPIRFNDHFFF